MHSKCIVFDLDHTIGYFKQFIQILNHMDIDKKNDSYFYLFDLFPEYFRPNIFQLFEYLILKRKEKKIKYIILYTNNKNDIFINKVIEYIDYKINDNLFDIIITTTHPLRNNKYKDYYDLLFCAKLDSDTNVCFIDDKKHPNMICNNVFYIRCEPYIFYINVNEIYERIKVKIQDDHKGGYMLNLNNHKRVTEQIFKRIECFVKSRVIIQT
jgi:hypothetical protein